MALLPGRGCDLDACLPEQGVSEPTAETRFRRLVFVRSATVLMGLKRHRLPGRAGAGARWA